jgi:hypothetical protein
VQLGWFFTAQRHLCKLNEIHGLLRLPGTQESPFLIHEKTLCGSSLDLGNPRLLGNQGEGQLWRTEQGGRRVPGMETVLI